MRVEPGGIERVRAPHAGAAQPAAGGFRAAIARRIQETAARWRELIGGEPEWSAAPVLRPPARPAGLEWEAPETKRLALREIALGEGGGPAMERMRIMLKARLDLEETILARASARGR